MKAYAPVILLLSGGASLVGFFSIAWVSFFNMTGYLMAYRPGTNEASLWNILYWAVPLGGLLAAVFGIAIARHDPLRNFSLVTFWINLIAAVNLVGYFVWVQTQPAGGLLRFEVGYWIMVATCVVNLVVAFLIYQKDSKPNSSLQEAEKG